MSKPRILLQLDVDPHPSVFDSVVAVDSGVEHLLRHGGVTPEQVESLVHGAMFTRGPKDLASTAIFVGGADVTAAERLTEAVVSTFFGALRVSVMLDANGANTTAAAAVLAARRHVGLSQATAVVLGGTGPVGQRAARLLAGEGCKVRVGSRSESRAAETCGRIADKVAGAQLTPLATDSPQATAQALEGAQILIAAGAAGVELVDEATLASSDLDVAVDLNAVPPLGIGGLEVHDRDQQRHGVCCYGAIGVGGDKMKIHRTAIKALFESNDLLFDAEELYELGKRLDT